MSDSIVECPLCLQELDSTDMNFQPCLCIYKVCSYCWYKILISSVPNCPGCRKLYNEKNGFEQLRDTHVGLFHSIRMFPRYGPGAFQFLQMLAYFQSDSPIPTEIFKYSPSTISIYEACMILTKLEFIKELAPNTISIEKSHQTSIRRCCDQSVLKNVLEMYENCLQINDEIQNPKNEDFVEKIIPHAAESWICTLENQDEELIESKKSLFYGIIIKLDDYGMYPLCLKLVQTAIPPVVSIYGPNHIQTLRLKSDLGTALWRLDFYEEALDLLNEILPYLKIELGSTHWLTFGTLNEIAFLLDRLGRREEAVKTMDELMVEMTPDHPDYSVVKRNKSVLIAKSADAMTIAKRNII